MIVPLQTNIIQKQYNAVRNDLVNSGVVASVSRSETRITDGDNTTAGLCGKAKTPALQENFKSMGISPEFGKTVNWQIKQGRDFDAALPSDSIGLYYQ